MRILRAPENNGGGYGLKEPAPRPKQISTNPLEVDTYGGRAPASRTQRKEDDWNELKGLRNALFSLIIRSVLAIIVWGGIVWAITPLIQIMAGRGRGMTLMAVSLGGGLLVGIILSRGLADRAGFVSPILSAMACVAVVICILTGSVAGSLPHQTVVFTLIPNIAAILAGGGMAVFKTMMDD